MKLICDYLIYDVGHIRYITLKEWSSQKAPNEPNIPSYNLLVSTEMKDIGWLFHASLVENHYVLQINGNDGKTRELFGIANNVEEVDRRLYETAKKFAFELGKEDNVRLEDLTRYASKKIKKD